MKKHKYQLINLCKGKYMITSNKKNLVIYTPNKGDIDFLVNELNSLEILRSYMNRSVTAISDSLLTNIAERVIPNERKND